MVNRHPTNMPYMRASGEFGDINFVTYVIYDDFWMADVPGFEPGSPA